MLRLIASRKRLFAGIACGIAAWFLLPLTPAAALPAVTRAVIAWDTGVLVFLAAIAWMVAHEAPSNVPADAERQHDGQRVIFLLTIGAVIISFAAIISEYGALKSAAGFERNCRILLVAATLVMSWAMLQVTYALRYAHEYYRPGKAPSGFREGLQFPKADPASNDQPDYYDFLYFAFVLGMTFQVSDVQIADGGLRRIATLHGALGFFFNTIIIALTVNIGASLFS